jgi:hypothetical protein
MRREGQNNNNCNFGYLKFCSKGSLESICKLTSSIRKADTLLQQQIGVGMIEPTSEPVSTWQHGSFLLSQTVGLLLTYFLELKTRKYRYDACMIITFYDVLLSSTMLIEYVEIFAAISLPLI